MTSRSPLRRIVTCSAADWTGNVAIGSFPVVVTDVTPPSPSLPAPEVRYATGPTRGSNLSIEQADRILADVTRIQLVLGC